MRDQMIGLGDVVAEPPTSSELHSGEETNNDSCYICLGEPIADPYRVPSCGHVFCFECLRQWQAHATSNKTCPACRSDDVPDLEQSATENARLFAARALNQSSLTDSQREEYRQRALAELDRVDSSYKPETIIQTLWTKSEVFKHLGRHQDAIDALEEIVRLNKLGVDALREGESLCSQYEEAFEAGRDEDAEAISERMEALLGNLKFGKLGDLIIDVHLSIAENMEKMEDWDGAAEVYTMKVMALLEYDSTGLNPKNFTVPQQRRMYMGLSRCFYYLGDYEKSIDAGGAAIEMNRHFPQVHKYVALSQKATGDVEAALLTMSRAVLYETPWDDVNKKTVLEMYERMKEENAADSRNAEK
jgi:tetratricopeptide (TPR) repeat protein